MMIKLTQAGFWPSSVVSSARSGAQNFFTKRYRRHHHDDYDVWKKRQERLGRQYFRLTFTSRLNHYPPSPEGGDDENEFSLVRILDRRWKAADKLEMRLDATIVSCHVLARFFVYDVTLPIKDRPGMDIADIVALVNTFTSAAILSILWTIAGLFTRLFETVDESNNDYNNRLRFLWTALLAAPPWLVLELMLDWPTMESPSFLQHVVVGCFGLLATVSLSRLVPKSLR